MSRIVWLKSHIYNNPLIFALLGALFAIVFYRYLGLRYDYVAFIFIITLCLSLIIISFERFAFVFILFFVFFLIVSNYKYSKFNNVVYPEYSSKLEIIEVRKISNFQEVIAKDEELPSNILLKLNRYPEVVVGDILKGDFKLKEPKINENFNYKFYLQMQGISYVSKVRSFQIVGHNDSLFSYMYSLKYFVSRKLKEIVIEPHASLIAGILWGEQSNMPYEFSQNLSRTGTTHIIAVSGFNISILVIFSLKLAGIFPRRLVIMFIILFLFLFMIIVGLSNVPALRATIMGYVALGSKVVGRRISIVNLLIIAILILLFINPFVVFGVSFQLSVTAMLGLLTFSSVFEKYLLFLPNLVREEFAATLSAILFTTPITLYNFSTFSFVAPIVNLFVLPVTTFMMLLGFIEIVLIMISKFLAELFLFILIPVCDFVINIINGFGQLEFASIQVSMPIYIFWLSYLVLIIIFFEIKYRDVYKKNF